MLQITLPYGHGTWDLDLPKTGWVGTFLPKRPEIVTSEGEIIEKALDWPVESATLEQIVEPGMGVAIVTSDNTRPCPNSVLLPPLIERLNAGGVPDENITIVIALGLHRPMTDAELRDSVGEDVFRRVKVINHDVDDVVEVGRTSRGTPVEVFRLVVEADFRVCVGNVEFHYFAGFSGGAKALVPGVAAPVTVNRNHGHMVDDAAVAARLEGNPVREDLEEAAALVGADFILNVVVDEYHKVIDAVAGDPLVAHRILCQRLQETGIVDIPQPLDIAIVSAGGNPKDLNLYQAQKALDNCSGVVRQGGLIVLLAQCPEGYGNNVFQQWMTSGKTPIQLLEDIRQDFVLGGHKAAAISKIATNIKILLVTGEQLAHEDLAGISVYHDLQLAVDAGFELVGQDAVYAVFPHGASTLPKISGKSAVWNIYKSGSD
ncbi:MAG: nickel-dependent lactate racemase [Firmicutes bacterium]|nr:nickel-dependent lactate racemase [Bacillota bacterium]